MVVPKKPHGYNDYNVRKGDDSYVRPPTSTTSPLTKRALEELGYIKSWAEFVEICQKQKAKRGY